MYGIGLAMVLYPKALTSRRRTGTNTMTLVCQKTTVQVLTTRLMTGMTANEGVPRQRDGHCILPTSLGGVSWEVRKLVGVAIDLV